MFTLNQVKQAHSKVKSGADFPSYISEIKTLGVVYYQTYVTDGHIDYYGANNYRRSTASKYDSLTVAETSNSVQFNAALKAHQQGKTDYPTFRCDCAKSGIEKWAVCLEKRICTYYDKAGNKILVEEISSKL